MEEKVSEASEVKRLRHVTPLNPEAGRPARPEVAPLAACDCDDDCGCDDVCLADVQGNCGIWG